MLLTRSGELPTRLAPGQPGAARRARRRRDGVRDRARQGALQPTSTSCQFYTWGDLGCCLPRGATHATLARRASRAAASATCWCSRRCSARRRYTHDDADRASRWAVRLTAVQAGGRSVGQLFDEPPSTRRWRSPRSTGTRDDALPFPLCVGVQERPGPGDQRGARQHRARRPRPDGASRSRSARCPSRRSTYVRRGGLRRAIASDADTRPDPAALPARARPRAGDAGLRRWRADLLVPLTDERSAGSRPARLVARDPHDALPQVTRLLGEQLGVPRDVDGRGATCSPARRRRATSSSRSRTTARALLRFGDDEHGERPERGHRVHARPTRRQRQRRQRRRRRRSPTSSATSAVFAARAQPDAGGRRHRARGHRGGPARRARGVPHPGARGHRGRLRRRRRAAQRRAARRGDVPLDRQLAHGVRHRRPLRRRAGRRAVRGAPAPPSRALPHGRLRPRGRRAALRGARRRAAHLRAAAITSARRCCAPSRSSSATACCPTAASRPSIPTASRSASRCT